MRRALVLLPVLVALIWSGSPTENALVHAQNAGDNVILVTIDGTRTEEIFGGLDLEVLKSTLPKGQVVETSPSYRRFWAASREERRRKLMPFLWTLVSEQGSIAGDAQAGSVVRLRNRHWFSYPGYAEILLGEPNDDVIKSNDPIRNPFPTVLEGIREQLGLAPEQVATFGSWSVFNEIVEHTSGATFVNAGIEAMPGAEGQLLNALQTEVIPPWDDVRFDALTFRLAMNHLAAARPRVLYLALDETDDWAHDGKYDRVLAALARTDAQLQQLWTWIQNDADYRGRTHLLVTVDHGRGHTPQDWRNHGATVPGSDEVWMAFASPGMLRRGIWQNHAPLSTSQIAATIASWMGVDWHATRPNAGRAIH
jgi:hypothetical protein